MANLVASFDAPRPEIVLLATEPRTGVHLSDLLSVRKTYFSKVSPKPITDSEALYFLAGRGHEDVYGRISGLLPALSKVVDGISYRPDFLWFTLPTEFKTRRSNLAKPGEENSVYETYLNQLKGYCCLDESPMGILIVFSLLEGKRGDPRNPTHPEMAVYNVSFETEELVQFRAELNTRKHNLLAAVKAEDPNNLGLCVSWQCGSRAKTKDGWSYVPRCKWYQECRPDTIDTTRG
jgi:hypothetical protein